MKNFQIIIFLTLSVLLFSCKNTNSAEGNQQTDSNSAAVTNEIKENSAKEKKETTLYAWVDKLRIREKPTTKSEIVEEVKEGTSFVYLNEKTDYKERINLRGTLYNEPWLKIKTADGKEGWVYGGAVKFYEPVVDANPSPYDQCFELFKNRKYEKYANCIEKNKAIQLRKDAKYVLEEDLKLTLTLLSGKKIELENDTTSLSFDEYSVRSYLQYFPQIGYFLIDNIYHEGGSYSLINDKSGKETIIQGYPKPSPNFKHFITTNADAEVGFEFNGIEIYGFPNGRLKKLLEKQWDELEPHTPIWLDDKTVQISLISPNPKSDIKPRNIKIMMNEKGDWEIQE